MLRSWSDTDKYVKSKGKFDIVTSFEVFGKISAKKGNT